MKKFLAVLLALSMVFALCACSENDADKDKDAKGEVYTFILATDMADDHPYVVSANKFAELCDEYSDGRIEIKVMNNGVLSTSEREMYESLQMGNYEMCVCTTSPLVNFDSSFSIFDVPFLFNNRESAYAALDGELGDARKASLLESSGLRILGWWECGFFNFIYNSNGQLIESPDDLKGYTIRCMETPITMSWLATMGANPVPMAFGEVYTSLQQGTIDGTILPYTTSTYSAIYEVCDHYGMLNITYCPLTLTVAESAYQALPDDLKEAMDRAAKEATAFNREYTAQVEAECLETMSNGGCEVYQLTDDQLAVWNDAIVAAYDKLIADGQVTQEDIDLARSFAR